MIQETYQEYDKNVCWETGQRIQKKRMEKGYCAVEVSACLNITSGHFSKIENGRANCTIQQLYILAQVLDCSVDYFLFGDRELLTLNEKQSECLKNLIASFV